METFFFLFLVNVIVYIKKKRERDTTKTLNRWHRDKNPPNRGDCGTNPPRLIDI